MFAPCPTTAKVTVIDFTVTMAGLEDQLLGKLIRKEKSELESQRQNLLAEVGGMPELGGAEGPGCSLAHCATFL